MESAQGQVRVRVRVRARVRVGRFAPAEAVELGTRDGAWRVAGARGDALRDRDHEHQRVGVADGALLGLGLGLGLVLGVLSTPLEPQP